MILAGGLGTRLREETEFLPKPMVPIGVKPILWHIMKNYATYNFNDFIICAGYKADVIRNFFLNYQTQNSDFTVRLNSNKPPAIYQNISEDWSVTISDTGVTTQTGGRIHKIKKYVDGDTFLCTYGDGLTDLDMKKLVEFHHSHGKIATVSVAKPLSRFGVLEINEENRVRKFREKPQADNWVNIGFFVFNVKIFEFLDEESILEGLPLGNLAKLGELMAYKHEGFWQSMDTFREMTILNDMWKSGQAPWKNWES